jgi:2-hydroxy-6-oxonona-2,4-dienedioate hydrolase
VDRRRWDADARPRLGAPADGPAVVLVHELVVSARYTIPAMKRLALRHRVYALDLPGFGKSGKPAHVTGVPGLSDALACWMRKLGLSRTALVGNSMGCQIIAELAARHILRASLTSSSR